MQAKMRTGVKMSFFEKLELWKEEYLILKYVFLDLSDYKNLVVSFPIGLFLIFMTVAFTAAAFVINHRQNLISYCVRQLVRHEAVGEGNAKGLKELRLTNSKTLRKMILGNGQLAKYVKILGFTKPSYEEYMSKSPKERRTLYSFDLEGYKIYIPEDMKDGANKIALEKRSTALRPIILSIVFALISAILFISMPEILELLNDAVGSRK